MKAGLTQVIPDKSDGKENEKTPPGKYIDVCEQSEWMGGWVDGCTGVGVGGRTEGGGKRE